jgi:hypothetical protein
MMLSKTDNGEVSYINCHCCIMVRFTNLSWKIHTKRLPVFKSYIQNLLNATNSQNHINGRILIAMEEDCLSVSLEYDGVSELYELLEKAEIEIKRAYLEKIFAEKTASINELSTSDELKD